MASSVDDSGGQIAKKLLLKDKISNDADNALKRNLRENGSHSKRDKGNQYL